MHFQSKSKDKWVQNQQRTAISTNNFDKIHIVELVCIFPTNTQ